MEERDQQIQAMKIIEEIKKLKKFFLVLLSPPTNILFLEDSL
jgi:hypothetical protein